jgi:N-acetylneuraminic acid mutarotase
MSAQKTGEPVGATPNSVLLSGSVARRLRRTSILLLVLGMTLGSTAQEPTPAETAPGEWTWVSGSSSVGSANGLPGIYGTLGVPSASNVPGSRIYETTWKDSTGNFWMFGGSGYDVNGSGGLLNDVWELNPSTNIWTWMGGSNTFRAPGVYGTLGVPAAGNIPGARNGSASWVDGSGNLWLFGGEAVNPSGGAALSSNDLWKFSPITNQWTWVGGSDVPSASGSYGTLGSPSANNIPGARYSASTWMDTSGNLWLFGGYGVDSTGVIGYLNDLWELIPSTGQWAWISGSSTVGSNHSQPGVYGVRGTPAAGNVPGGREDADAWTDSGGNFWLFGGYDDPTNGGGTELNDLWEFSPSTNLWTWMGGSSAPAGNQRGVYGTLGTAASTNLPGGRDSMVNWIDQNGNLWLFGGDGYGAAGEKNFLSDLWEFNPFTNEWTWMDGSNSTSQPGEFGSLGVPGPGTIPGSRDADSGWIDQSGNLWLLAGHGLDGSGANRYLNDLWEYQPAPASLPAVAAPTFSVPAGTYGAAQTVTINAMAGATIYYTTNGTAPNTSSPVYGGGSITVSSTETLEAVATASGYSNSATAGATYTILTPTAPPTISLASGTYDQPQMVTISDATPGAIIYYAINGTPTTSSAVYNGSIAVSSTETLEAIALAPGYFTSAVATASYTDTVPAATSAGEWTWVSGSSSIAGSSKGVSGVLGTLGVPAPGNVPESRNYPATWTDSNGNFWLLGGTGYNANGYVGLVNDFWEFNKATNLWTWMGGGTTPDTSGIYGTQGVAAAGNMPGSRSTATVWQDGSGNLWVFGGAATDSTGATGYLNDLWKYTTSTNQWTWMSGSSTGGGSNAQSGVFGTLGVASPGNMPGGRDGASGWTDSNGNLWLYGGSAYDANGVYGFLGDLWEYTPSTSQWTWMGGSNSLSCTSCYTPAVYGTEGAPAAGNTPGGRRSPATWTDSGGNFWLFGGYVSPASGSIEYNDLWEFSPSTNQWTWVSGSNAPGGNQNGVYGTLGTPAPGNIPGGRDAEVAWTDAEGNLWLFGGYGYNAGGGLNHLGDLWEYSPFTNEWTWMVGSNTNGTNSLNKKGVYGTLGIPGAGNVPGSRSGDAGWLDQSGNLWLIGGNGEDANTVLGFLNDLWEYQLPATLPQAATPTLSVASGTYTSIQTVTIGDTTPGETIYYTTNGTAPNINSSVYSGAITVSSSQTLEVIAVASGYAPSSTTTAAYTINLPVTPTITWAAPAPIAYGTALSGIQLDASASVAGTFVYSPAAGTVLTAGTQTLSVTFTPTDTTDYTTATATVQLTVNQAAPTISWSTPAAITYGTALSSTQLNASSAVSGTFVYNPAIAAVLTAGTQTLSVTFTPTDTADYTTATATVQLTVNQVTPTISWSTPAAITYGTALSATQLDATSSEPGTFAYTPAAGTVPGAGSQSLSVTFTPTDATDYTTATGGTTLMVNKATPTVSFTGAPANAVYGSQFTVSATTNSSSTAVIAASGACTNTGNVVTMTSGTGVCSLTATWAADNNYVGASSAQSTTATKIAPTVAFTGAQANAPYESTFAVTATTNASTTAVITASGSCSVTGTTVTITAPSGPCSLSATWAADNNFLAASAAQSTTATQATPVITWPAPATITYGTALGNTQLDATATYNGTTVAGTFVYTPAKNTVLTAGTQTLSVTFTPNKTADFTSASASVLLQVNQATPKITWTKPAAITYGTALSSTQLDATASVPGTFVYSPATGTVLTAGSQTLSVVFTPTDAVDYTTAADSVTITVKPATPTVTWATPAAITYGTPLSGAQLDATASVPGTFVYSPAAGAIAKEGSDTLSVTFTPTDDVDYTTATASVTLQVKQATPTINWTVPAAINYGTALSNAQLDAAATYNGTTVAGTFVYTPAKGTVLTAGAQTLSVTFTPGNTTDYATPSSVSVTLQVNPATPKITWAKPAAITYGTALSATQLDATASVAGTFAYSPAADTVLDGGSQTLSVTFSPTDTTDYTTASDTVTLTVNTAASTTTITSHTPNPATVGQVVTVDFSVTGTAGVPTGSVTVTASTGEICSASPGVTGTGNCTLTFTAAGSPKLTATYGGDSNFKSSTSAKVTETVN